MIERFKIQDLQCACVSTGSSGRIIYIIYPLTDVMTDDWLEKQSVIHDCSIVVIYVPLDRWNDYLTPWPAPGETPKARPFAGDGSVFLKTLQQTVIPLSEDKMGIINVAERDLIGVSLSGLFTLWEWLQCGTFHSIASLSGSFWYPGFMNWFDSLTIPAKDGKAYFLLGAEEPDARIKAFRSVGINTQSLVASLKNAGIKVSFDLVPGNHFSDPLQRLEKALTALHD